MRAVSIGLLAFVTACSSKGEEPGPPPVDSAVVDSTDASDAFDAAEASDVPVDATPREEITVNVTIDGKPSPDTLVVQGGNPARFTTDSTGNVKVKVDRTVKGDLFVMASHPEARIMGDFVTATTETLSIALTRFDPKDNEAYVFQDPGEPTRRDNTTECAHCHVTLNEDWFGSPHRASASNPVLHDLYAGAAASLDTKTKCDASGGKWWTGIAPGKGTPASRCYLGDGTLPALNPTCGTTAPCDGVATKFGECASCHAPAIDGKLANRDLLEAKGLAFDYGVHCDVCHRTESVDLTKPAGVGGKLHLVRPSEKGSPVLGEFLPLTFGPSPDSPNPRMGSVQRDHFKQATLCAGCHEHDQAVLVAGGTIDATRWPSSKLPVHTTYGEWKASKLSPTTPCQVCHMPPDLTVWNGANLEMFVDGGIGVAGGWVRPPGSVHHHSFLGPRQPTGALVPATVVIEKKVVSGTLTATITVRNTGAGHSIPTGDPLRSMILVVEATCSGTALDSIGGAAIPDFGGYLDKKTGGDWTTWPGAKVGEIVRVVKRSGGYVDYIGFGPFGDGTFTAAAKGMPIEDVVGFSTIATVVGDKVTFDKPLPSGDVAYRSEAGGLPVKGGTPIVRAGAPGFGFARVMVGKDGRRMVPHFLGVDVASDNRILASGEWKSDHQFAATCSDPTVHAVLVHRAYPIALARERGWTPRESILVDSTK